MDAAKFLPFLFDRIGRRWFRSSLQLACEATDQWTGPAPLAGLVYSSNAPQAPAAIKLHLKGISKKYGETVALAPLELMVRSGELLALVGPSGSGKTTLMHIICGLTKPSSGRVILNGQNETDNPADKRDVGMVFQNYALFPHLTVKENVEFPLRMRRMQDDVLRDRVEQTLSMVGLSGQGDCFPHELSGGQQQRVALARCIVYRPSLILMDESLSALDRKLRESMRIEIKRLHRETAATIIFVTHDQEEALALADRVCVMNRGRIEQLGTPVDIYERPENVFVADFIGAWNVLDGRVATDSGVLTADGTIPNCDVGALPLGMRGALVVRPERVVLCAEEDAFIRGMVTDRIYRGSEIKLIVRLPSGATMAVRHAVDLPAISVGEQVFMNWDERHASFLTEQSGSHKE